MSCRFRSFSSLSLSPSLFPFSLHILILSLSFHSIHATIMILNLLTTALVLAILGVLFLLIAYVVNDLPSSALHSESFMFSDPTLSVSVNQASSFQPHFDLSSILFLLFISCFTDFISNLALLTLDPSLSGLCTLVKTPEPCLSAHARSLYPQT